MTRALVGAAALALVLAGTAVAALVVELPSDMVVEAESADGAAVMFTASATNPSGKQLVVTCEPASGTVFPIAETPVTCSATDGDTLQELGTFRVVVQDTRPPLLTPLEPRSVEANGPTGAVVNYTPPTAVDAVDGPAVVTCQPPSGKLFPLGETRVVCAATDARGNTGTAEAAFAVVDTTPPTLIAPAPLTLAAATAEGVSAGAPALAQFLAGAHAADLVTAAPAVTTDAPSIFSVGTTTVTFTARDAAGNAATATAAVTVLPAPGQPGSPAPGQPAPPAQADRTPPGTVSGVRAVAGDRAVTLTWTLPTDRDLAHVAVTRSAQGAAAQEVFRGRASRFVDRSVRNGIEYRYVLISVDTAGNGSLGVAVTALPIALPLHTPRLGARVTRPPVLRWQAVRGATYYNVQLYRGTTKILTAWPARNRFALRARWTFANRRHALRPGTYRWYVWPAMGTRSNPLYGTLLGTSTFTLVPTTRR